MKATLKFEFDLPQESNEFQTINSSRSLLTILQHIREKLRSDLKHNDLSEVLTDDYVQELQKYIWTEIEDEGVQNLF